jgi:FtsZ-binding cell division protein ZapB
MKRLAIIFSLLLVTIISSSCGNSADYDNLTKKYHNVINENNEIVTQYNELRSKYNQLINEYNELHSEYNQLVDKYNNSTEQYEHQLAELQERTKQLLGELDQIHTTFEGAIVPPYLLVEDRKVNLVFRNLNGELEHWYWGVEALEASIIKGQFMREINVSDLNYLGLHDIANRFTKGSKYIQLSGQGRFLDFRPYVIKEPFEPLASDFFSRHSDDESKIKEVWNMVTQLDTYSKEITETPRLPLETLLLGGGDCEDLAILTASILKAMSPEWDVSLVYMDADNPAKFSKLNHVTVFVDTGKYKTFVESTQGHVMSPWVQVDGFYFKVQ